MAYATLIFGDMIRALSRAWRRIRFGAPVVIVSGLPRSGTSMIMQMLSAGGLDVVTDETRGPDQSNPRGYFELERVKGLETGDVDWVAVARGKAVKVIAYLLEYLPPNLNYRVIFIIRNLEEVLASQAKMLALQGGLRDAIETPGVQEPSETSDERMREIFFGHLARARRLLAMDPGFDVLYLRHDAVLRDPPAAAEQVASFIGGGLDVQAMAAAVDPALHRERAGG